MIKHFVAWTMKESANGKSGAENALMLKEKGEALINANPFVEKIEMSVEILDSTTIPAQLVLLSTHKSKEDLKAYASHQSHLDILEFFKECTSSRVAVDFEV